jgi:hypothetical protein
VEEGRIQMSNTAVIEARTDIRLLATLDAYFSANDATPSTKSELVRLALEHLHDILVINGKINQPFNSMTFTEATTALSRFGNMHKAGHNRAKLTALLSHESLHTQTTVEAIPAKLEAELTTIQQELSERDIISAVHVTPATNAPDDLSLLYKPKTITREEN